MSALDELIQEYEEKLQEQDLKAEEKRQAKEQQKATEMKQVLEYIKDALGPAADDLAVSIYAHNQRVQLWHRGRMKELHYRIMDGKVHFHDVHATPLREKAGRWLAEVERAYERDVLAFVEGLKLAVKDELKDKRDLLTGGLAKERPCLVDDARVLPVLREYLCSTMPTEKCKLGWHWWETWQDFAEKAGLDEEIAEVQRRKTLAQARDKFLKQLHIWDDTRFDPYGENEVPTREFLDNLPQLAQGYELPVSVLEEHEVNSLIERWEGLLRRQEEYDEHIANLRRCEAEAFFPFVFYEVDYGVCCRDSDVVEVGTEYVTTRYPDEESYYITLRGKRIMLAHVARIDRHEVCTLDNWSGMIPLTEGARIPPEGVERL